MANLLAELKQRESVNLLAEIPQQSEFDPTRDISVFGVTPSDISGAANLAQNIATGLVAQPIAGVTALPDVLTGEGLQAAERVQEVTEQIQTPLSESGQEVAGKLSETIDALGDSPAFAPIVEQLKRAQSGFSDILQQTGAFISDPIGTTVSRITGEPLTERGQVGEAIGGALSEAIPQTALEVSPFIRTGAALRVAPLPILSTPVNTIVNTAKTASRAAGAAFDEVGAVSKGLFKRQSSTKREIARLISEGSTDVETAAFKLIDEPLGKPSTLQNALNIGGPRVQADKVARETIKQGFDDGVIAAVKGSSPADKTKMLKMVNLMERGKKNAREAIFNRPSGVAGDSLLERFKVVNQANKDSGKALDGVAKSLKGQTVDSSGAVNRFVGDLDEMGIKINNDFSLDFRGSILEGTSPEAVKAQSILKTTVNRLLNTKIPDAFDVHRMKKFIDSQVTFGKTQAGLAGGSERVLKKLRRGLDESLDSTFPEYDRVNKVFSETRTAIDNLQDVAGKKLNLTGKNADEATGTLLRRLMSNAQSRIPLLDSVKEIENVAIKNGGKFNDDIITQVLFADELDAVFKPIARTSFQGQIKQAIPDVPITLLGASIKGAEKLAEKVQGINEANAFKSIKELLKGQ